MSPKSSFFSLFTAGLACVVPFVNAYTKPVGAEPKGNPIYQPGLNSVVPVGKEFEITWDPTTEGTVTLVLLKGPATDLVPVGAIAEKIPNSGKYEWTPSKDLAPGQTGYGIQLIVDATGQYQYTTQFGISNPGYNAGGAPPAYSSQSESSSAAYHASSASHAASHSAPAYSTKTQATAYPTQSHAAPTGGASYNTSAVQPSKSMTVPTSLYTAVVSASGSYNATGTGSTPVQTQINGAAGLTASFGGLVVAAAVAVFAL